MKLSFIFISFFSICAHAHIPPHLTVGTYNLHGLQDIKALKEDLSQLPQVQIWAFQEVEGDFTKHTDEKILSILPPGRWYILSEKVNLLHQNLWEGQVIASRFPISSKDILSLEHTSSKKRIALLAKFKKQNGEDFFFVNTDHEVDIFSLDFKDRKKQLQSLIKYFENIQSSGVIAGDFNTAGGKNEIIKTEKILSGANFTRIRPAETNSYTFKKAFIKTELDHFFSRGARTSFRYKLQSRKGSDHYPIYMDVMP